MKQSFILGAALATLMGVAPAQAHKHHGAGSVSGTPERATWTSGAVVPQGSPPAAEGVATLEKLRPGTHYTVALVGATGMAEVQGETTVVTFRQAHDTYDQRLDLISVFPLTSKDLAKDRAVISLETLQPHLPVTGWLEFLFEGPNGGEWRSKHLVTVTAATLSEQGLSLTLTSATPIKQTAFKFPAFYGWTSK